MSILNASDIRIDKTVKIQGTQYDRKRKLSDQDIAVIKKLVSRGKSIKDIAELFDVRPKTIRYNIDPDYRTYLLSSISGVHTGKLTRTFKDRVTYKRSLLTAGIKL